MDEDKRGLIDQIVEKELAFFLEVPAMGDPLCRKNPDGFRLHRRVQFLPWSPATLNSYLHDLAEAEAREENPLTRKYARMMGARSPGRPQENEIVERFCRWQADLQAEFPVFMRGSRPLDGEGAAGNVTGFRAYLEGEVATYSDETLRLLLEDVNRALEEGRNLCAETYEAQAEALGYANLAEVERVLRARRPG